MPVPPILWTPSRERIERATITRFAEHAGRAGASYGELWRWSVEDLDGFWRAIWSFFDVQADGDPSTALGSRAMPGATWFPDVRLSLPEHVFRGRDDGEVAIRHASELRALSAWTWGQLREETARIATGLRRMGVGPGDRVAAYLPNVPETAAAFLACASLGATWSSAAPEFGARSVVDRFAQIEPRVLLAVDGYSYGGRDFDRRDVVAGIRAELPTVEHLVTLGHLDGTGWPDELAGAHEPLRFERVPFDHPLWV
ncbi:MAG TPA: AMP-binding protein, partial [Solirubrobacteraceae bacterium]|nr:AMP-binding protein [Solirubrobacteraceae bacterium]